MHEGHRPSTRSSDVKKLLLFVLGVGLLGGLAVGGYLVDFDRKVTAYVAQPFGSEAVKVVEVPSGTGPQRLATLLAQNQVVADADLLYRYLRREKLGPKLRAGEYEFTGLLTPAQVIQKIVSG